MVASPRELCRATGGNSVVELVDTSLAHSCSGLITSKCQCRNELFCRFESCRSCLRNRDPHGVGAEERKGRRADTEDARGSQDDRAGLDGR